MFKCSVCSERQLRINELKEQIAHLRQLVSPPTSASRIPLVSLEADKILSADNEVTELSSDQIRELEKIESEAVRILSGTY